jgi:hypothetical protein
MLNRIIFAVGFVVLLGTMFIGFSREGRIKYLNSVIRDRTELFQKSQVQVDELLKMNQSNLLTIQASYDTIQQLVTREPEVYCISHHPFAGYPWILEIWWKDKLLWVPLVAYHTRTAAEDTVPAHVKRERSARLRALSQELCRRRWAATWSRTATSSAR